VQVLSRWQSLKGDRQVKGVDFFATFAPVVNWTTVHLMLILSSILGLSTYQVDFMAAFIHAPIDEDMYVDMPRGFSESGKILKLKKSLYGLSKHWETSFNSSRVNLKRLGLSLHWIWIHAYSFQIKLSVLYMLTILCSTLQS
jgi:hypothetical protein